MTRTIWKYEIPITPQFTVQMPSIADVLCVQVQKAGVMDRPERICIWVLLVNHSVMSDRHFRLYQTGHTVDHDSGRYIGTVQTGIDDGLVFHLFEVD